MMVQKPFRIVQLRLSSVYSFFVSFHSLAQPYMIQRSLMSTRQKTDNPK